MSSGRTVGMTVQWVESGTPEKEKVPGQGWIVVKGANRGRVARGKPGSCGLSNRHEHQRTQGMNDTFRGLNGVDEELIGC